jgi:DNA-binding CsgD family transcriptional regulator
MGANDPQLDRIALRRLRDAVTSLNRPSHCALPIREIVSLSGAAPRGPGYTIDFEASRELGEPFIVVRVPSNAEDSVPDPRLQALSAREREVAVLVTLGLSNKRIAQRLMIATSTVKDHVHSILEKTGLPNRASVAAACRGPLSRR